MADPGDEHGSTKHQKHLRFCKPSPSSAFLPESFHIVSHNAWAFSIHLCQTHSVYQLQSFLGSHVSLAAQIWTSSLLELKPSGTRELTVHCSSFFRLGESSCETVWWSMTNKRQLAVDRYFPDVFESDEQVIICKRRTSMSVLATAVNKVPTTAETFCFIRLLGLNLQSSLYTPPLWLLPHSCWFRNAQANWCRHANLEWKKKQGTDVIHLRVSNYSSNGLGSYFWINQTSIKNHSGDNPWGFPQSISGCVLTIMSMQDGACTILAQSHSVSYYKNQWNTNWTETTANWYTWWLWKACNQNE